MNKLKLLIGFILTITVAGLVGLGWSFVDISEDLQVFMSFLSGMAIGPIGMGITILWATYY